MIFTYLFEEGLKKSRLEHTQIQLMDYILYYKTIKKQFYRNTMTLKVIQDQKGSFHKLKCNKDDTLGAGHFGKVTKCTENTVRKSVFDEKNSLETEKNFTENTGSKNNRSWVQMYPVYKLVPVENEMIMESMDTSLDKIKIEKDNLNSTATLLQKQLHHFHETTKFSHNDIKPANIGVRNVNKPNMELKFIDLGSVTYESDSTDNLSFTMQYMSQLDELSVHENRKKVDRWALGCSIYEMVCRSLNPGENEDDCTLFGSSKFMNSFVSVKTILDMTPCNLKYILGLSNVYEDSKHGFEKYLKPKRDMFKKHTTGPMIFNLMKSGFDESKLQSDNCKQSGGRKKGTKRISGGDALSDTKSKKGTTKPMPTK